MRIAVTTIRDDGTAALECGHRAILPVADAADIARLQEGLLAGGSVTVSNCNACAGTRLGSPRGRANAWYQSPIGARVCCVPCQGRKG